MSVNEVKLQKAPQALRVKGTGPATARTFCIGDEDHTLGNAVRHVLIRNKEIDFAGYSVPHPAEPIVHVRVQANDSSASDSLKEACRTLSGQCDIFLEKLEELIPETRDDRVRMEQIMLEEGYEDEDEDEE